MKIVKCLKCGKYIHKAPKCLYCGNTAGFDGIDEVIVHDNVIQDYTRMEVLVEDQKYDEAIALSYTILEWMPNLAGVFWLRLLAKNKCSTAIDLICKGFACDDDSDFCNALSFSVKEEHIAYEEIKKAVSAIRVVLKKEIDEHEHQCKSNTNIMHIKKTMQEEIERRKQKLFSLWSDLEDTEHSLYELEMDCKLLIKEHQIGLEKAVQAATVIKGETYRMQECTEDKLHSFQVRMGNVLQQSEVSKDSINSMKNNHPWVKSFKDLVSRREQELQLINCEIASLESYKQTVQQTISEIEQIEEHHKMALEAAKRYDFANAAVLLGENSFNQILCSVGVGMGASISSISESWKSTTSLDNAQSVDADDKIDMEEYYAVLGLDED